MKRLKKWRRGKKMATGASHNGGQHGSFKIYLKPKKLFFMLQSITYRRTSGYRDRPNSHFSIEPLSSIFKVIKKKIHTAAIFVIPHILNIASR